MCLRTGDAACITLPSYRGKDCGMNTVMTTITSVTNCENETQMAMNAGASTLRPDLQVIADLIAPSTKVLDLGCADGELLAHLIQYKQVRGRGIELSEAGVLACVRRG